MNEAEIRKYASLMRELDLTGIEIDEKQGVIRLERERDGAGAGSLLADAAPAQNAAASGMQGSAAQYSAGAQYSPAAEAPVFEAKPQAAQNYAAANLESFLSGVLPWYPPEEGGTILHQVSYSFEPGPDGTSVLVLKPQELKPGYSSIRFGGAVESDFRDHSDFNLILSHTWGWMNSWGGQWRNQVQLGETKGFSSEFVQPLGPGSPWFVMPRLSFEETSYDVYQDGKARHRWSNEEYRAQVRLGRELWDLGVIAGGIGWVNRDTTRVIGSAPEGGSRSSGVAMADLYLDTLDRVAFPTRGWNLSANVSPNGVLTSALPNSTP